MDVNQLRVLRELGDRGSITAVAETLFVSPSAVSQQLAALQRTVNVPLTVKNGRNLTLTDAGRLLAESTGAVLSALDAAKAAITDYQESSTQRVTVSAYHSAAQTFLAPLLTALDTRLGAEAPLVEFFDEDVPHDQFVALTATYDLVIAHRMTHAEPWPSNRVTPLRLLTEPFDVAIATDHRYAAGSITPQQLTDLKWVVAKQGYSPFDMLASLYAGSDAQPEVVHRINDYATAAQIVAVTDLATLVPRHTGGISHIPGVALVPLQGVSVARSIDVLTRPERRHRRAVQEVLISLQYIVADVHS